MVLTATITVISITAFIPMAAVLPVLRVVFRVMMILMLILVLISSCSTLNPKP